MEFSLVDAKLIPRFLNFGSIQNIQDDMRLTLLQMRTIYSRGIRYLKISSVIPRICGFKNFSTAIKYFRAFLEKLGLKLSGYTNTASAFLLKSISELDGSGRLAYIMPLEFLNTGYGTIVKRRLIEDGHLSSIISFACEKDVFPDVTTSVGVILYDASRFHTYVDFHTIKSVDLLSTVLEQAPVSRVSYRRT